MRKQKFAVYAACFSLALASITTPNFLLPYATAETSIEDEVTEEELNQEALENTSEEDISENEVTEDITEYTSEDDSEDTSKNIEDIAEDTSEESTNQTTPDNKTTEEITSKETTEDGDKVQETSEESTEEELIEMEMDLLMAPSPDTTSIEINSQDDWNEFINLRPSAENPECKWGNTGGNCVYIGDESEVTIQINADITVASGSPWFVDGDTTVPTKFNITGTGSVNGTFLFPTQYEYAISGIKFINSTVQVKSTTSISNVSFENSSVKLEFDSDLDLTGTSFNNSTVEFVGTTTDLSCSLNGCSFTNGSVLSSTANPIDVIFTNTNVSDSSMFENNDAILSSLSISGGTFSNDTTAFQLTGNSNISNATFTNTDINLLNNIATNVHTVTGCTFNNSHFTSNRSSATLNIEDSNFDGNTKSIIENVGTGNASPVVVSLNNVTGTNCHADFVSQRYKPISFLEIRDVNISTSDSGLTGIKLEYMNARVADVEDVSINGFDEGIYLNHTGYYDLSNIMGVDPHPHIDNINRVTVANCNIGLYLISGAYVHVSNSNITCRDASSESSQGIHFKNNASGSQSSLENTLQDENNSYYNIFDSCEVKNCYVGFYGDTAIAALLINKCTFDNVNSGYEIHGGGSGDSPQVAFKDSKFTSRENYDNKSVGLNLSRYGASANALVIDCDLVGFDIGIEHTTGGSGVYIGNEFKNAKSYGIKGYCDIIADCSFKGSTEVFIYNGSATMDTHNVKIVGDSTNIGLYSDSSTFTINTFLEPISYSGGNSVIALYERFKDFSNKTFTDGKTEIQNCKIGVKHTSSPLYMKNTYIHDCETGIENTGSNHFWYGGNVINNCDVGYLTNEVRAAYVVDISVPEIDKIANCNTGIKFSNSGGWYDGIYNSPPDTYTLSLENNDIGIDASTGTHMYSSGIDFLLKGNKIGMLLTPGESGGIKSITTDSNSEQAMIITTNGYNNGYAYRVQKLNLSNDTQAVKLDGVVHIMNSYSGQGTIYLDTPESYIYNTAAYTNYNDFMIFDMPTSDYQDGRIVARTTTPNWVDSFLTNKEGWIIVYKQSVDDSGEPIDDSYDHYLTAGCLVTYDYATNGGTSMSGTVTGSEMYASTDVNYYANWKYKAGNPIDLTPIGVKDGYEFVGWNTDPDATEGLTSLTAGTKDVTLYAIYKTTKAVTYHTFNTNDDFTQNVDFYNNQTSVTSQLASYSVAPHDLYSFAGYVLDENESDLENNILSEGDNFDVSDNQLDVYCVYDTQSVLTYKDVNDSTITTDTKGIRGVSINIATVVFRFILINHIPVEGYTFDGWLDSEGGMHDAGTQYIITDHAATVKAVESEIYVDSLAVTPKESTIMIGKTVTLTATVTPDNALNKDIAWSVDDDGIATVDRNGVVTGVSVGEVTVTATNQRSGKSDTATIKVVRAETQKPVISISNDYKVTLTAGEVTNDTLDKIYYRINEGEWQEYNGAFPAYKQFKVEAYQTTLNERIESDIAMEEGTEYATGITAEYIGDDKFIGEDVSKPEVIVTVHYPNSSDETVTDFNLIDYTIDDEGSNDVTVTYNEYPEDPESPVLTSTITVVGKEAKTEKPSISVSDDCKVTLTPGEVTNDTLDKIYYRVNDGEWQEYKEPFPVYKKYTVEAYQVTKIRHVESDKVSAEGTEYATGITAEYIGDDKFIGEDVTKPEVIVTVHYPNSSDETVTDFNLMDYTIKVVGPNKVTVTYKEYPEDPESPTLTSTVTVEGIPVPEKEPETRIVTIKGILKYSDGTPIANKTIKLNSLAEIIVYGDENTDNTKNTAVGAAKLYETTTDKDGNYEFKDIYVGEYELSIWDGNISMATCNITVSAPEKDDDAVNVTAKKENVAVNYDISGDIIKINATITPPKAPTPTTEEKPEPTTESLPPAKVETPKPEAPKTGDNVPVRALMGLIGVSGLGIFILGKKKKKND